MDSNKRVVVIGGGLAGMAAAVALESAGITVTLLEARKTLGGRAGSFAHPETGEILDNCQHVLLGCCTNLIDFYSRIGAIEKIQFERTIHFVDGRGGQHDLWGFAGLPAPLHLGPAMLTFGALNDLERLSLGQAMLAMMTIGREGRSKYADISFGDWLSEHDQPAELIEKIYQPLITGALNEDCDKASAEYALEVFQDSLLANRNGYLLGLPNCPLGELYANLPCRDVRLGQRIARLLLSEGIPPSPGTPGEGRGEGTACGLTIENPKSCPHPNPLPAYQERGLKPKQITQLELATGEIINCDAVILATNYEAVRRFIDPTDDPRISPLENLSSTPILGAHLFFDIPVMQQTHVAFLEGPLQWLFKKDSSGRIVHGVISAARDWLNRDRDEMANLFANQIRATFPAARQAKLLRSTIVIEKRATFAPFPRIDQFRPTQSPPPDGIQNLFLAGDYTLTGWPATMEGAVRSGYLAAEAVLSRYGINKKFLVNDLPPEWPARLLGAMGKK
ncbi:MAG TPA: FAD-dependent oxidoreductase [Tepidisphaeraceae bacterium]|jgi:zeta-carotene desaturase